MLDLSDTILAKSDQLNACDLVGGGMVLKITDVKKVKAEQPLVIDYQGSGGRPYKPSKGMRVILVSAWGKNGELYKGRELVVYCEPSVKYGGVEVGGIRISHMSHIDSAQKTPLKISRNKTIMYEVNPISKWYAENANTGAEAKEQKASAAADSIISDIANIGWDSAVEKNASLIDRLKSGYPDLHQKILNARPDSIASDLEETIPL